MILALADTLQEFLSVMLANPFVPQTLKQNARNFQHRIVQLRERIR